MVVAVARVGTGVGAAVRLCVGEGVLLIFQLELEPSFHELEPHACRVRPARTAFSFM